MVRLINSYVIHETEQARFVAALGSTVTYDGEDCKRGIRVQFWLPKSESKVIDNEVHVTAWLVLAKEKELEEGLSLSIYDPENEIKKLYLLQRNREAWREEQWTRKIEREDSFWK